MMMTKKIDENPNINVDKGTSENPDRESGHLDKYYKHVIESLESETSHAKWRHVFGWTFVVLLVVAGVFATILPNVGSSNYAVYTIPRNYVGIIFQTKVEVLRSQSASISGAYWVRPFQGSPRFRRPYTASNAAPDEQAIPNGITFAEKTDIALTITSCSNNNTTVIGRFDIVLVSTIL